jgi:hypothetical protein
VSLLIEKDMSTGMKGKSMRYDEFEKIQKQPYSSSSMDSNAPDRLWKS